MCYLQAYTTCTCCSQCWVRSQSCSTFSLWWMYFHRGMLLRIFHKRLCFMKPCITVIVYKHGHLWFCKSIHTSCFPLSKHINLLIIQISVLCQARKPLKLKIPYFLKSYADCLAICLTLCILQGQENGSSKWIRHLFHLSWHILWHKYALQVF